MISSNGNKLALHFSRPPRRVISLVPSLTESLFDLGFGSSVIGITDFCTHPADGLGGLPRLGGPKNPDVQAIISLQPDLILLNQEENTRPTVEALQAAGMPIWMTFPRTIRAALDILWTLAGIYQNPTAAARVETIERTVKWNELALEDEKPVRFFCPIWQETSAEGIRWWMTFNQETYAADVLRVVGGMNVFSERKRRYPMAADLGTAQEQDPGEADTRYPRVTLEEILRAEPELILLPDEPFNFTDLDQQEMQLLLRDTPAGRHGRVHLVEGSLITWHGTRLARAITELPSLFVRQT
ncbi:MAG: helical backbone metal receptor [Anaerolineales bacterium]|jgi:iron complex transport system substrate-binding protein